MNLKEFSCPFVTHYIPLFSIKQSRSLKQNLIHASSILSSRKKTFPNSSILHFNIYKDPGYVDTLLLRQKFNFSTCVNSIRSRVTNIETEQDQQQEGLQVGENVADQQRFSPWRCESEIVVEPRPPDLWDVINITHKSSSLDDFEVELSNSFKTAMETKFSITKLFYFCQSGNEPLEIRLGRLPYRERTYLLKTAKKFILSRMYKNHITRPFESLVAAIEWYVVAPRLTYHKTSPAECDEDYWNHRHLLRYFSLSYSCETTAIRNGILTRRHPDSLSRLLWYLKRRAWIAMSRGELFGKYGEHAGLLLSRANSLLRYYRQRDKLLRIPNYLVEKVDWYLSWIQETRSPEALQRKAVIKDAQRLKRFLEYRQPELNLENWTANQLLNWLDLFKAYENFLSSVPEFMRSKEMKKKRYNKELAILNPALFQSVQINDIGEREREDQSIGMPNHELMNVGHDSEVHSTKKKTNLEEDVTKTYQDSIFGSDVSSVSSSDCLVPALPVTFLSDEDDEEHHQLSFSFTEANDAEAYLRSVRWEAKQISVNSNTEKKRQTDEITAERVVSGVLTEEWNHSHQLPLAKRRCGYVEYLLQLDKRSADKPPKTQLNVNFGVKENKQVLSEIQQKTSEMTTPSDSLISLEIKESDVSCLRGDDLWRVAALQSFTEFRKFLELLVSICPRLSGEAEDTDPPEQRDWDEEQWIEHLQSIDANMDSIGAMDSVRAISVLETVASYLKSTNRDLAFLNNSGKDNEIINLADFIKPSIQVFRRLIRWTFAALANLDELQALEADVAHVLQVIRRCCRWLKTVLTGSLQSDVRLIEVIVQDSFNQR